MTQNRSFSEVLEDKEEGKELARNRKGLIVGK
jgi:hypothetical protein